MIKPLRNSYGYQNLLVYKKAEELQLACVRLTAGFPREKTLVALADQMARSARSVKQNIIEGWKRNSTSEYYQFLGYAEASNAELEADCADIIKGIYGKNGLKGLETGERDDIEKIPFYPLDPLLPLPLQLKLRTKELNFLLDRLQASLVGKMAREGTLSLADKLQEQKNERKNMEIWYDNLLKEHNLIRLENGRVIKNNPHSDFDG